MKGVYLKKGNTRVSVVPYYRIGDLFLTTIATNPSNFLGGNWELFGPGRCLVCVDTSQTEFNSVKKTGGSKNHYHVLSDNGYAKLTAWSSDAAVTYRELSGKPSWSSNYRFNTSSIGGANKDSTYGVGLGGNTDNSSSLQPYITCYIWIRTA